jgi:hypothetical protein
MIVIKSFLRENTEHIKIKTWEYLQKYRHFLYDRKNLIYKKKPKFFSFLV